MKRLHRVQLYVRRPGEQHLRPKVFVAEASSRIHAHAIALSYARTLGYADVREKQALH